MQGQDADLNDLQRILNCSKKKLSKNDQLNMTVSASQFGLQLSVPGACEC